MGTRIIAGELKGRKLLSVRGIDIRPTANRTRESIFNILTSHVNGAMVLDLFAGTGALGIEALSRGAQGAFFIDSNQCAIDVLRRNIQACSLETKTTIIRWNILKNLDCITLIYPPFDLVFMDPPYARNLIEPSLSNLHASGCLKSYACITIEHAQFDPLPEGTLPFRLMDQRKYGKTLVSFLNYVI